MDDGPVVPEDEATSGELPQTTPSNEPPRQSILARGWTAIGAGVSAAVGTVASSAGRMWGTVRGGRARRTQERIEAARAAARIRADEVAGLASAPVKDAESETPPGDDSSTEDIHRFEGQPDETEASEAVEPVETKTREEDRETVETFVFLDEEESEVRTDEEPRVADETIQDDGDREVSGDPGRSAVRARFSSRVKSAAAHVQTAVGKAASAVSPHARSAGRGSIRLARSTGRGLRRVGIASGAAIRAIGRGVRRLGVVSWAGLVAVGRASRRVGRVAGKGLGSLWSRIRSASGIAGRHSGRLIASGWAWLGTGLGRFGRMLGERLARIRRTWQAQPPRPRLWISIGAGLVIVIGYLLALVSAASRLPAGTNILGIDVGGVSVDQARGLLEDQFAETASSTVSLSAHGRVFLVEPDELGLSIDLDATLDSVAGFSLSPAALWRQAFGGGEVDPVIDVREDVFARAVDEAVAVLSQEARNAVVTMEEDGVRVVAGQDAVDVDAEVLSETLLSAWPSTTLIPVPASITPPSLGTEEAKRFSRTVNGIVLGSPVTMTSPNGSVVFTPADVASFGSIEPNGSSWTLTMDGEALAQAVVDRLPGVENPGRNAHFSFDSSHRLVIEPGIPGRTLDVGTLDDAIVAAATSATRTGQLPMLEVEPEVTTADLENSDFKELVATYYTAFVPRERSREHNIATAARKLSGYVVEPGEIFSITKAISPITRSGGYVSAGVIVGGVHTDGMGGGLCQIATTTYVAAYLVGLDIVERAPHSEWFSRYPAGRDAAIAEGLDMRVRNDTPYALMFNAYIENAGLRVDIWSTPYYTVEASSSGKYNVRGGGYRTETESPCYPSAPKSGFSITDYRKVYLDGELVKDESRVSSYRAVSGTQCG